MKWGKCGQQTDAIYKPYKHKFHRKRGVQRKEKKQFLDFRSEQTGTKSRSDSQGYKRTKGTVKKKRE